MTYPRVLVIAAGRINAKDAANNGLLLRNIFGCWPKENLAQIYGSMDNGDEGFFGRYYKIGTCDRRLGRLFFRLKAEAPAPSSIRTESTVTPSSAVRRGMNIIKSAGLHFLLDTGAYELIFKPRLSQEMLRWIEAFKPEIIFSQGYFLTYTWLPLMLAERYTLPIAYYPTDDWPTELYRNRSGSVPVITSLVGREIDRASRRLVGASSVCIAFNPYMQEEYLQRYGKAFTVMMHGDEASRFGRIEPRRLAADDEYWIVCTGIFDDNRLALLGDLDRACAILRARGIKAKASVFPVNRLPENVVKTFAHTSVEPCPTHDGLAAVLKGADVLFLPERFDGTAHGVKLSVSSKAHLFMFSGRPIVVYSDRVTGISRYASEEKWAVPVVERDAELLARTLERLHASPDACRKLIDAAEKTAMKNHDVHSIRTTFLGLLTASLPGAGA